VNAQDRLGCPPLFSYLRWADPEADKGDTRPAEAPLVREADFMSDGTSGGEDGVSPPTQFEEGKNLAWFDASLGAVDLRATDNTGATALHVVASLPGRVGAGKTFGLLVEKGGLDPLTEDHLGRSSLDVAAETGKEEVLELFRPRKG
jgi:hypothetical protein